MHDMEEIDTAQEDYILDLLRLLCNPTTPHTVSEVWCRLHFPECVPLLKSELKSDNPSIIRLVLDVFRHEAELRLEAEDNGYLRLPEVEIAVADYIQHNAIFVRQAAIGFFDIAGTDREETISAIHNVMLNDHPIVAVQAANALAKIWPQGMDEVTAFLVEKLKDTDSIVVSNAAEGIGGLGPKAVALVPMLKALLVDEDANWEASIAILTITGDASDAKEVARQWCESGDWVRRCAGEELVEEIARIVEEAGAAG